MAHDGASPRRVQARPMQANQVERAARLLLQSIRLALSVSSIEAGQRRAAELYLLVTACNVNQALAAEVAGCTKQNVSKLLASVEDRRENAEFDRAIAAIEAAIRGE